MGGRPPETDDPQTLELIGRLVARVHNIGALGAFEITVDAYRELRPGGRGTGTFGDVILHEMAHVMGFSNGIWDFGTTVNPGGGPRGWVEHMLVPEVQSPEFFSRPVEYPADDVVPESALAILNHIADGYGHPFLLGAHAFKQFMEREQPASGHVLDPEQDQPSLDEETVLLNGDKHSVKANLYHEWLSQRARLYFQDLPEAAQEDTLEMLGSGVAAELLRAPVGARLSRVSNRLQIA